jgi:hypothetical protein
LASQPHRQRDDHRAALSDRAPALLGGLAVLTTASTFAPWGTSGTRSRNSYAIVDIADRAGVVPSSMAAVAVAWFLIPALCGLVLVALASRRVRLGAVLATTLGALVAVGGVLVARSPLAVEPGATLATAAGACTVLASVAVWVTHRDDRAER